MTRETKLSQLAHLMMLTPAQAVALPTTITVSSGKVGKSEEWMIDECFRNAPLASYLAQVCRQVI